MVYILGVPVSYHDLESIDPEYASSLQVRSSIVTLINPCLFGFQWLLDNEIDSLDLELYFSLETDVFGATEVIQLRNNGAHIPVNDENKVCSVLSRHPSCIIIFLFSSARVCPAGDRPQNDPGYWSSDTQLP